MERGIIFTGESVRAILDRGKTQTRRVVKPVPEFIGGAGEESDPACWGFGDEDGVWHVLARGHNGVATNSLRSLRCRYGVPGDRLWVREAFRLRLDMDDRPPSQDWWKAGAWHEADGRMEPSGCAGGTGRLRSPLFMPRWASRILLEITDVRAERVDQISEEDALADGGWKYANCPIHKNPRASYMDVWDRINGRRSGCSWADNPWCWVIDFQVTAK